MIRIQQQGNAVSIFLRADIINQSQRAFDLITLQRNIDTQLTKVYHNSYGRYSIDIKTEFRIIKHESQCSTHRLLFQIVDSIPGNNPAEADFKGLRIKLNKNNVTDIIAGKNFRTIPHELGHLLGLDHPHARAVFESVNKEAHSLEQQLSEEERQHNLMSQTWYIQKANIDLRNALQLAEKQIEVILDYYKNNQLNKNRHLKHFLFWKRIV